MVFEIFYEYSILATTLIGSFIGGWIDLKTSEVPDSVPLFIVLSAMLLHIANGFLGSGWQTLGWAFGVGLVYLAFGYLMFYSGQWGEADVLLLASIGFAIPQPLSLLAFNLTFGLTYPLIFLINTFVVGAVYSIVYATVLAFRIDNFWKLFKAQIVERKRLLKNAAIVIVLAFMGLLFLFQELVKFDVSLIYRILFFPFLIGLIFLLYAFAHTIDKHAFRKIVNAKDLREGDVLANEIPQLKMKGKLFIGLTVEQIKKIQKIRKTVEIKEGIRYIFTFFLAIVATMLFGNMLLFLLPGI